MKTIITLIVVAAATVVQAADIQPNHNRPTIIRSVTAKQIPSVKAEASGMWVCFRFDATGMQVLQPGVYKFIFVSSDPVTKTQETVVDTTGTAPVPPPDPPVPPTNDVATKLAVELAKATEDRAGNAATISGVLAFIVAAANQDEANTPAQIGDGIPKAFVSLTTKTPTWKPFVNMVGSLASAATTKTASVAVLQTAIKLLEGVK